MAERGGGGGGTVAPSIEDYNQVLWRYNLNDYEPDTITLATASHSLSPKAAGTWAGAAMRTAGAAAAGGGRADGLRGDEPL